MNAQMAAGGQRAARDSNVTKDPDEHGASGELEDSWFKLPKRAKPPATTLAGEPPPPPALDDGLADEWFL
jgi:hypothetical protein